jgi:rod shape-determining protein MreD
MNLLRWLVVILSIFIAVILQPILLTRLNFPGATVDLILVLICAWAIAKGPIVGASAGFIAGLLIDLTPPTEPIMGLNSFALVLIGFVVGLLGVKPSKSFFRPLLIVAFASVVLIMLKAALTSIFESPVAFSRVSELLFTQAIYTSLLAVFVIPLVTWLDRKLGPTSRADELRL